MPSEPVVNDQLDSSRKALDIQCSSKQEDTTQSQDKSEHLEQPVYGAKGVLSCSEVDIQGWAVETTPGFNRL